MSTSTAPCFTAVDSWVSQDEMCLNVTFTAEPEMNNQNYHVRFTFPTWFIMGRQPYRAPHGTVRCSKAVISSTEQTIDCTSAGYPSFFAVFNMNSNQAAPSQYTQMSIVNNDKSTIPCVLKQWCPPIVTDATTSGGAGGDSSSQIPAGYINLPLIERFTLLKKRMASLETSIDTPLVQERLPVPGNFSQCCFWATSDEDAARVSYVNLFAFQPLSALKFNYSINLIFPTTYVIGKEPYLLLSGTNVTCVSASFNNTFQQLKCESSNSSSFSAVFDMLIPSSGAEIPRFTVEMDTQCTQTSSCSSWPENFTASTGGGYMTTWFPGLIAILCVMVLFGGVIVFACIHVNRTKRELERQHTTMSATLNNVLECSEKARHLIHVQILETPAFDVKSFENLTEAHDEAGACLQKLYHNHHLKGTDNLASSTFGEDEPLDQLVSKTVVAPGRLSRKASKKDSCHSKEQVLNLKLSDVHADSRDGRAPAHSRKLSNVQELKARFEQQQLQQTASKQPSEEPAKVLASKDRSDERESLSPVPVVVEESKPSEMPGRSTLAADRARMSALAPPGALEPVSGTSGKKTGRKSKMLHKQELLSETLNDYANAATNRYSKESLHDK
ncbi:hypothetical protein BC830DRAFT_1080053 [Chytriomyces sp. MP71]|nr:hypothetical protein BC830DRAFT_1080053 [Chytriomyces sp. MP71]